MLWLQVSTPAGHAEHGGATADSSLARLQGSYWEYQKCVEPQYNDTCVRARVDEARRFAHAPPPISGRFTTIYAPQILQRRAA